MLRYFVFIFTILSLGIVLLSLLLVVGYYLAEPFIEKTYYSSSNAYPYPLLFFITTLYNLPKIIRAFYRAIVKDNFNDLDKFE